MNRRFAKLLCAVVGAGSLVAINSFTAHASSTPQGTSSFCLSLTGSGGMGVCVPSIRLPALDAPS